MAQRATKKAATGSRAKTATRSKTTARRKPAKRGFGFTLTPALSKLAKEMGATIAEMTSPTDAISLLQADHRKVEGLFKDFEKTDSKAEKGKIASKICLELRVHTAIEEELVYPPAHEAIEEDLVDEAIVEHAGAKDLIKQIEGMRPGEDLYDAKVKVLSEYIKHHVKEEENEMFPQLRKSGIDLKELGIELKDRKAELLTQMAAG